MKGPTNVGDDKRKIALNLRNIPADLRNQFKAICSQNEMTMTGAIEQFMADVVAGGGSRDFLFSEKT